MGEVKGEGGAHGDGEKAASAGRRRIHGELLVVLEKIEKAMPIGFQPNKITVYNFFGSGPYNGRRAQCMCVSVSIKNQHTSRFTLK
jgi:hypothetical protein